MLMKTPRSLVYLSADELGITPAERAGLIEVRDDLASGRVKHWPIQSGGYPREGYDTNSNLFNMAHWYWQYDCGTCHCIGGFMEARKAFADGRSNNLQALFAPDEDDVCWGDLTTSQAVRAIDHFLNGANDECWPLALADEPA